MKSTIYISQNYRKGIAIFLMLYFIISTVLVAFPASECNGFCEMDKGVHTCTTMMDMEESCCDMMEMSEFNSVSCEVEFAPSSCSLEIDDVTINDFVITPKFQPEQSFVIVSTIDLTSNNYNSILSENKHIFIAEKNPPIYISVQSFLN